MASQVILGGIVLEDTEVPDEIPFGGSQAGTLHKLLGGARSFRAMGRDDAPISWSGIFLGPDASTRARQVDQMRIAGQPVSLSWDGFAYTVIIQTFVGSFRQSFYVPYQITLEVLSDDVQPIIAPVNQTVDDQVISDMTTASGLAQDVDDPTLTAQMIALQTQVSAAPSFLTATQDVINGVIGAVGAAQGQVAVLIDSTEGVLNGLPGFAGVVAGAPAAQSSANLLLAAQSFSQCTSLYQIQNLLGRMTKNLSSVQAAGTQITTDGISTLYDYAAGAYGDPEEWTTIARANGLADPQIQGGITLLIPTTPDGLGGVLQT